MSGSSDEGVVVESRRLRMILEVISSEVQSRVPLGPIVKNDGIKYLFLNFGVARLFVFSSPLQFTILFGLLSYRSWTIVIPLVGATLFAAIGVWSVNLEVRRLERRTRSSLAALAWLSERSKQLEDAVLSEQIDRLIDDIMRSAPASPMGATR